jgi:hypothetical protein
MPGIWQFTVQVVLEQSFLLINLLFLSCIIYIPAQAIEVETIVKVIQHCYCLSYYIYFDIPCGPYLLCLLFNDLCKTIKSFKYKLWCEHSTLNVLLSCSVKKSKSQCTENTEVHFIDDTVYIVWCLEFDNLLYKLYWNNLFFWLIFCLLFNDLCKTIKSFKYKLWCDLSWVIHYFFRFNSTFQMEDLINHILYIIQDKKSKLAWAGTYWISWCLINITCSLSTVCC